MIIVGSGIAGLFAALKAAGSACVCLLTKATLRHTNTWLAQGGIAAAISGEDSPRQHYEDTLAAGAGLCNEEAAFAMAVEGPGLMKELSELGVPFDRHDEALALTREGAHRRDRVLHCGGDATGRLLQETLLQRLISNRSVTVRENTFVTDLLMSDGRVCGVKTVYGENLLAGAVILATGGLGQVYERTTNPEVATGDGVAMAYRAGAAVADMEFIQFHPTVFQGKREDETFLVSEAVRGEGAVLINGLGQRFMTEYHEMAELGPRDVVSRAILDQVLKGKGPVYLDITGKNRSFLKERFPTIYRLALEQGFDLAVDRLPVSPAAHYAMGGVLTGLNGETGLPGLYACGEVACTGVHGANRLASNSLLEGLVFAARAIRAIQVKAAGNRHGYRNEDFTATAPAVGRQYKPGKIRAELRRLMFEKAGVLRDGTGLRAMSEFLDSRTRDLDRQWTDQELWELRNMFEVGRLIIRGALARSESRGAHSRSDYPETDGRYARRLVWTAGKKEEELYEPVAV
jgi:L-aspartate oxidase